MTDEQIDRVIEQVRLHAWLSGWDHAKTIAVIHGARPLDDTDLVSEMRAEYAALTAPKWFGCDCCGRLTDRIHRGTQSGMDYAVCDDCSGYDYAAYGEAPARFKAEETA